MSTQIGKVPSDYPVPRPEKPKWQLGYLFSGKNKRALEQYQLDLEQWYIDQEAWYNAPEQERDRLREGGYSGNLLPGQGGVSGGGQISGASERKVVGDHALMSNPLNVLSQYTDIALKSAQAKLVDADATYRKSQTAHEDESRLLTIARKFLTEAQYDDLVNEIIAKDSPTEKGAQQMREGANVYETYRHRRVRGEARAAGYHADQEAIKTEITQETLNWLKANNLSKWIPLITAGMRFF